MTKPLSGHGYVSWQETYFFESGMSVGLIENRRTRFGCICGSIAAVELGGVQWFISHCFELLGTEPPREHISSEEAGRMFNLPTG